jgi:hypothetical protein
MTMATCNRQQQLARDECKTDYFAPPDLAAGDGAIKILFGVPDDDRWIKAMK